MGELETTLLLPVAALEDAIGRWRAQLDPAASDGILPHMTLNYPWLSPCDIGEDDLETVATIAAAQRPFEVTFSATEWFGAEVVWVAPDPAEPVRELATEVLDRWPECPLYGNTEWTAADIIPHVTIGYGDEETLGRAERDVLTHLPVVTTVDEIWMMQGIIGERWDLTHRFPLGAR